MKPLVSINCTTYNHGEYIEEALESFLMQKTDFSFEILIHDDASTDNTILIIEEYKKKYPDIIKPIIQKENQQSKGVKKISYLHNHKRALGKYIAVCEGDDYWTDPYKLQKQVDYMEKHDKCTFCFHSSNIINSEKKVTGQIRPYLTSQIVSMDDLIVKGGSLCATSAMLYKKSSMDNPPDLYFNAPVGDYPLQLITSHFGYAYYLDENMSIYRKILKTGSSWSSMNKSMNSQIKLYDDIDKMLVEFNEYTDFTYNAAIVRALDYDEFYNIINKRQITKVFSKKNFTFFNSLSLKNKLLVIVRLISPSIYVKLLDRKYK